MSTALFIWMLLALLALAGCGVLLVRLRQQVEQMTNQQEEAHRTAEEAQAQINQLTQIVKMYQEEKNERVLRDNLNKKLMTLARATSGMSTLPETLRRILDVTSSLTNAEVGSLLLLDASGRVIDSITSFTNSRTDEAQTMVGQVMDKGLAGWVVRTKEMAYIPDVSLDERWIDLPNARYKAGAVLCVPIIQGHIVMGVLTLIHPTVNFFRQEDKSLMQSAASQIALALGNAQIFEGQRRMVERQASVYELLQAISNQLDAQEIVEATVQTVVQLTGWPLAAVLLPTLERDVLQLASAAGTLSPQWPVTIPLAEYPRLQRVWHERYTDNISNVAKLANYIPAHPALQSELVIPLRRGHQLFGLLVLGQEQSFAFAPEDILLAESMAETAALVLVNAELYTTLSNYTAELRTLYTVMRTVNETVVYDRALKDILEVVQGALGYDAGLIALHHPHTQRLEVAAHTIPPTLLEQMTAEGSLLPHTIAGYLFYEGQQSLVCHNLQHETPSLVALREVAGEGIEWLLAHGYRACSTILLRHQGVLLGVLAMYAQHPINRTSNNLALQEGIGQQVATAVANAQLFQTVSSQRGRLEAILENSQGGLVMASPEQTIMVINQQAIRLLALEGTRQAWMGRPLADLIATLPAPAAQMMQEALGQWQAGVDEPVQEVWEFHAHLFLAWTSLPVVHEGHTLGRLFLWRDVSEERTVERLREDLIYTMVHDLRNPLHMIAGSLDLLGDVLRTDYQIGPNEEQLLDIAFQNTDRLLGLVNAILDINQLESRRLPLNYTLFEINRTISYITNLMSPLAQEKEIEMVIELDKGHQVVWSDRNLVERVLQNLVGNALKFTPQGGRVCVQTAVVPASRKLQVTISDSGPGIAPEIRPRLFEKFTMGSGQPKGQGNGLGLAFCKMAVEALNERVWLVQSSAEGTTFAFTLALPPQ